MQMPRRKTAVSDILRADAADTAARDGVASGCAEKMTRVQNVSVDKRGHGILGQSGLVQKEGFSGNTTDLPEAGRHSLRDLVGGCLLGKARKEQRPRRVVPKLLSPSPAFALCPAAAAVDMEEEQGSEFATGWQREGGHRCATNSTCWL